MAPDDAITVHLRDPKLHGALAALIEVAVHSAMLDHVGSRITVIHNGIAVTVEREGFPPSWTTAKAPPPSESGHG